MASVGIKFIPIIAKKEIEEDGSYYYYYYSNLINKQLYPLGITYESQDLAIDNEGNIYTLDDYMARN